MTQWPRVAREDRRDLRHALTGEAKVLVVLLENQTDQAVTAHTSLVDRGDSYELTLRLLPE
jgi:hypothetical protein